MGEISKIAWTDATFNPWWGCTKVSPGCDACYAERDSIRYGHQVWGHGVPRRYFGDKHWKDPIRWNAKAKKARKRMKVFCASMADILDNEVDQKWRDRLWELIVECDWIDWLLLTKRIGNARSMLPHQWYGIGELPANVWFGISVVNQEEARRDIPKLLRDLSGTLWLSIEPQLEWIMLDPKWLDCQGESEFDVLPTISWIVVGGESGSHSRRFDLQWARAIQKQCKTWNVPFFMKQVGSNAYLDDKPMKGYLLDWRQGADPAEWPADLRVRDFPERMTA